MVDKSNSWFTEGVENSFRGMVATANRNSHKGWGVEGMDPMNDNGLGELVPDDGCCVGAGIRGVCSGVCDVCGGSIADRTEGVALPDLGRCHLS